LAGTACSYKVVVDGKRQIVSFHIAGDAPDLQSLNLAVLDFGISAISPCNVAFVPHQAIRELCARHPGVANAFWRMTLVEAAIFREWMTGIGRRPAVSRLAHLFCEVFVRSSLVGLAKGQTITLPITQTEIGDAIGLSTVHTNRSLQELRAAKLVELKKGRLQIFDWDGLQRAADFDPVYLQIDRLSRWNMPADLAV
jgi:CRP-like cAMP-binding protein